MPKVFALRLQPGPDQRHRLDPSKIVETAKNLAADISSRLPGSTLAGLAEELTRVAVATRTRGRRARRPVPAIRAASALAIGLALVGLWFLARHVHTRWEFGTVGELFGALTAGFNLLVFLAGALWFCVTLEARFKRRETLEYIQELREFAHVIDVTQLYYTPGLYRSHYEAPTGKTAIDETYLLCCTQMLGVIGNLAPLYTRGATGDSILRAASEVQMLAMAIATKHLAKAEAARRLSEEHPWSGPEPGG